MKAPISRSNHPRAARPGVLPPRGRRAPSADRTSESHANVHRDPARHITRCTSSGGDAVRAHAREQPSAQPVPSSAPPVRAVSRARPSRGAQRTIRCSGSLEVGHVPPAGALAPTCRGRRVPAVSPRIQQRRSRAATTVIVVHTLDRLGRTVRRHPQSDPRPHRTGCRVAQPCRPDPDRYHRPRRPDGAGFSVT